MTRRVAIVGAGIAGLGAAHALAVQGGAAVTLFEASGRFGGHANTVDVTLDGVTHGVDTGFLVFNHHTYPRLTRLFDDLGVATAPAEMSFSVQAHDENLEWAGTSLASVFAQRRNLLRPRFLGMLADVLRFHRLAARLDLNDTALAEEPLGDFLDRHRFGAAFRHGYFLPMLGCIWSCPTQQMLRFPVATMLRFCRNHGLLQVTNRPQWYTVRGGSREYVQRVLRALQAAGGSARADTPVRAVQRRAGSVRVISAAGTETFDDVILACHAPMSLTLLDAPSANECAVLGAIAYQPNRAVLHTDVSVLPQRRLAWASWNYARARGSADEAARVGLHYLINKLQPLPWQQPVIVSLNPDPAAPPQPDRVLAQIDYEHPVFDVAAIRAQQRLPQLQGRGHVWFCGAWAGYGFHEDGLASAQQVVSQMRQSWQATTAPRTLEPA